MIRGGVRGFEESARGDHARLVDSFRSEFGAPTHEWVNGIGLSTAGMARQLAWSMHPEDVSVLNTLPEEQPVILFGVAPGAIATARPVIQQAVGQLGIGTPVFGHQRVSAAPAQSVSAPASAPASAPSNTPGRPRSSSRPSASSAPASSPTPSSAPSPASPLASTDSATPAPPPSDSSNEPPGPHGGHTVRNALLVGAGAVGVVGLGVWYFKRKPATRYGAAEFNLEIED